MRPRLVLPAIVAFSLVWWLLVPLSVGFGLRWLFTGHAAAVASVFNPADPSVYLLWLKVGVTTGAAFAIKDMSAHRGTRQTGAQSPRRPLSGQLILMCVAASLSAPFVIQDVEPHATRVPYLLAFALCGALFAIACSALLEHIRADEVNEVSAEPI